MSWRADDVSPDALPPFQRSTAADDDVEARLGLRLRRLRRDHRWSLDRLAAASGVSRAMLGQIELGKSNPTVRVLMRIAAGLGVDAAALLAPARSATFQVFRAAAADRACPVRALGTGDAGAAAFHALRLAPGATASHPDTAHPGRVNAVVARGTVEVTVDGATLVLAEDDAVQLDTSAPLRWRNAGDAAALVHAVWTRDG